MTDHASAQPPTPPAAPAVDPRYARRGVSSEARFAYDEPVALPVDADAAQQPPAAWKRPVPVVLDIAYREEGFRVRLPGTEEELPWAVVRRVVVTDEAGTLLASFALDEGWSSVDHENSFAHDIGSQHFTLYRMRFAAPAALDQALREIPGREVRIVAEDADKRVVSVDEVNGYLPIEGTIDERVRIGAARIRLGQDAPYARTDANDSSWRDSGTFDTDQAVGKPWIFAPADPRQAAREKPIPAALQVAVPLVLELEVQSPVFQEPHLAQGRKVYVFGDYGRLLATIPVADGWYTRTNWTPSGATGGYHLESLRLAIDPAIVAPLRGKDYASVLVGVVDAKDRTIYYEMISLPP